MLKDIRENMRELLREKNYIWPLILTSILSYGFMVGNPTIGIDDTASELYFQDGMAPYVGRWFLFLINKVFHFAEFAPFLTEFLAVLFMIISVTLWCVGFRRILGNKIPLWGYTFFSCIFLSAPILSEVFTYYMHNGIGIAYGLTAAGAIFFVEGMKRTVKKRWNYTIGSALFLVMAAGCYESMVVVYIIGIIMMYLLFCKEEKEQQYHCNAISWAVQGVVTVALMMIGRSLIITVIKILFRLEEKILVLPTRGLGGYTTVGRWFKQQGRIDNAVEAFFLKILPERIGLLPHYCVCCCSGNIGDLLYGAGIPS